MRDYLVFGTRYNKFDNIFEWIKEHSDAGCIQSSYKLHKDGEYKFKKNGRLYADVENRYFVFNEHSLVYNEELMLCRNTVNYQKTIVVLRDMYDVIDNMLTVTFKDVDRIVNKQIDLFEEYVEELMDQSHYILDKYKFFISYNRWCKDIEYRDYIGSMLGFGNADTKIYENEENKSLRERIRYRKHFTDHLKYLNWKLTELL